VQLGRDESKESDVVDEYRALADQQHQELTITGPNPTFEEYLQARLWEGYFGVMDDLSERYIKGEGKGEPRGIRT